MAILGANAAHEFFLIVQHSGFDKITSLFFINLPSLKNEAL